MRDLELIASCVNKFIDPEYFYLDFNASKEALIDLVALGIVPLGLNYKPPQLEDSQYAEVKLEAGIRAFAYSASKFDRLTICYKAFNSLAKSQARSSCTLDNYLLLLLSNALEKIISLPGDEQKVSAELRKNSEDIEIQIKYATVLHNFFKFLKNLNTQTLKNKDLTTLLREVGSNNGLVVSPLQLLGRFHSLLDELSLYLAEHLSAIVTNEAQAKNKALLIEVFERIKEINLIKLRSGPDALAFNVSDYNKISALFREYDKQAKKINIEPFEILAETAMSIEDSAERSSLKAFKRLFDMDLWDRQAKGPFGKTTPQGIKEIRSLLADETLSVTARIIKTWAVISQRLKKPIDNRSLLVHQCYIELSERIFNRFFSQVRIDSNAAIIELSEYEKVEDIINFQYETIISAIATMQEEIQETASSLERVLQRIPVAKINALLDQMSSFLQKQHGKTTDGISHLNALLSCSDATLDNSEGSLEVLKRFISAAIFLKDKIALSNNKPIKNKEDLFFQDLFAVLDLVAKGLRNNGYQALLDKIYNHKALSEKKLFAVLQNAEDDSVMASPQAFSLQNVSSISPKIEAAITEASLKLEAIVPFHQQWLGQNLVKTPLGKLLSSLRDQVEQIAELNYFPPTGIKKLVNAFKLFDNNPLQQDDEQKIIAFLQEIYGIVGKRLQQGANRYPLLQQFYMNIHVLFAELTKTQTVVNDVVSYEEIQTKAERLLANNYEFIAENGEFNLLSSPSLRNLLKQFMQEINDLKWCEKGLGFAHLYKKLPDGIAQLQKMFKTKELDFLRADGLKQPMILSATQKIELIKVFLQANALLKKKATSPNSTRDKEVSDFYQAKCEAFSNHFEFLDDKGLHDVFDVINNANIPSSTESILSYLYVPGRTDGAFATINPGCNLLPAESEDSVQLSEIGVLDSDKSSGSSLNRYSFHSCARASILSRASSSNDVPSSEDKSFPDTDADNVSQASSGIWFTAPRY